MNNSTIRKSNWILTLSLAAIAIAYLTLVWNPGRRKIRETQEEIQTKRQFVTQAADMANTLTASEKELITAESAVKKWERSAPRNRDLPALFGRINALAQNSGLAVTRFDPEPFVVHEEIREIPISIDCAGMFSQVFEFLGAIEKLPESIWVDSLRLEKTKADGGNVKFQVNLVVFSDNP